MTPALDANPVLTRDLGSDLRKQQFGALLGCINQSFCLSVRFVGVASPSVQCSLAWKRESVKSPAMCRTAAYVDQTQDLWFWPFPSFPATQHIAVCKLYNNIRSLSLSLSLSLSWGHKTVSFTLPTKGRGPTLMHRVVNRLSSSAAISTISSQPEQANRTLYLSIITEFNLTSQYAIILETPCIAPLHSANRRTDLCCTINHKWYEGLTDWRMRKRGAKYLDYIREPAARF